MGQFSRNHLLQLERRPELAARLLAIDALVRAEGAPTLLELLAQPAGPPVYLAVRQAREDRRQLVADTVARCVTFNPEAEPKTLDRVAKFIATRLPTGTPFKTGDVAQALQPAWFVPQRSGYLVDFSL